MINSKKILAVVLAGTLALSCAACTSINKEDVIDAAESFAKAVAALDGKKMLKQIDDIKDSKADQIKNKLSMSDLDPDEAAVKKAIADTITYEVDEDSVQAGKSNDEATVDVVFTMVDYAKVLTDDITTKDDMIDAIKDSKKTKEYEVTFELVADDGDWLIAEDTLGELGSLYDFLDYELSIGGASGNVIDMIDHTSWWMSGVDDNYTNATYIEFDVWFTDNPNVSVYYTVDKDGSQVYQSDVQTFSGSYFEAKYSDEQNAQMNNGYIAAGTYKIVVFTADGTQIADGSTTVTVDATTPTTTTSGSDTSTEFYTIHDGSFADIKEIGWWDYGVDDDGDGENDHGSMAQDGVYCIDTEIIAFSIELNKEADDIYYAYYFLPGEDVDASNIDYSNPTFADTISATSYGNGTIYYNIDYEPDKMEVGTYVLVIAKDAGSVSNPYVTAVCSVISSPSSEFIN
ncbi:hypothetical protein SAMN02910456_00064 [Ruminococcaceae bacterium YRB3002]|nr:hypothetical protein SAMN02910456_00064 [Ruminococcaceae bacterium YRB3002]